MVVYECDAVIDAAVVKPSSPPAKTILHRYYFQFSVSDDLKNGNGI